MVPLINFILYQVGWLFCVLGAAWDFPWTGMAAALSLVAVHLSLATDRVTELRVVLAGVAVGLVVDCTLLWSGVFTFPSGMIVDWLPPPWMSVLWMQFATTFHYSMRWLGGRYVLSGCFGFIGAPLAFFAGERLGAVEFLPPHLLHYLLLAVVWSIAIPCLIFIADRVFDGSRRAASYRCCEAS